MKGNVLSLQKRHINKARHFCVRKKLNLVLSRLSRSRTLLSLTLRTARHHTDLSGMFYAIHSRDLASEVTSSLHLRNGHTRRAGARKGLNSKHLVVVRRPEPMLLPKRKVVPHRHLARGARVLAHGPELREGAGAGDGGLVDAGVGADGVDAAVGREGAEGGHVTKTWIVRAEVLDDVVLRLRVLDPAIDGEEGAGGRGLVGGGEGDVAFWGIRIQGSFVAAESDLKGCLCSTYRAAPVFQPSPTTKSVLPFHLAL